MVSQQTLESLLCCIRETRHLWNTSSFHCPEGAVTWSSDTPPIHFQHSFLQPFSSLIFYKTWGQDFDSYKLRLYTELKEINQPFSASSSHSYSGACIHYLDVTKKKKQKHFWARGLDNKAKCYKMYKYYNYLNPCSFFSNYFWIFCRHQGTLTDSDQ